MSGYVVVYLLAASQTLLMALVLLAVRQGNRFANGFLVTFLFACTVGMLAHAACYGRNPALTPLPFYLLHVNFLLGPLLYGYVQALTRGHFRLSATLLWHALPALAMSVLLMLRLYWYGDRIALMELWRSDGLGPKETGISTVVFLTLMIGYALASLRLLAQHQTTIRQQFSSLEQIQLRWLVGFFLVSIGLHLLEAMLHVLRVRADYDFQWRLLIQLAGSMAMTYFLYFMALRQRLIFGETAKPVAIGIAEGESALPSAGVILPPPSLPTEPATRADLSAPAPKYQTSNLGEEQAQQLWGRLQQVMRHEQLYRIQGLKIGELAEHLGCSVDHLSQTINRCGQQNFFDLVNQYRVEEAARLLLEKPGRSVVQVGELAGFNSQSTFYAQFRKHYGMTPKQYRTHARSLSGEELLS